MIKNIYFGGGCFWCTEAVFQMLRGVKNVEPGYMGGSASTANYETVSTGNTDHVEVSHVEFDDSKIPLEILLDVFFSSHDPTTLNRQGNDIGSQYRSVVFVESDEDSEMVSNFIQKLANENVFEDEIVTTIEPAKEFYPAENYHINYYRNNQRAPYCKVIIDPKIAKLKKNFSEYLV